MISANYFCYLQPTTNNRNISKTGNLHLPQRKFKMIENNQQFNICYIKVICYIYHSKILYLTFNLQNKKLFTPEFPWRTTLDPWTPGLERLIYIVCEEGRGLLYAWYKHTYTHTHVWATVMFLPGAADVKMKQNPAQHRSVMCSKEFPNCFF